MSMNINRLIHAVECAAKEPGGLDYQHELDELLELKKEMEKIDPEKDWHDELEVVATQTMCELMNAATYDIYGRAAKNNGGTLSREEYNCKARIAFEGLTESNLECGYDIINDLWHDNEAEGSHDADGTFSSYKYGLNLLKGAED